MKFYYKLQIWFIVTYFNNSMEYDKNEIEEQQEDNNYRYFIIHRI